MKSDLISEISVSYSYPKEMIWDQRINDSEALYTFFLSIWNLDTIELFEEFKVVLLDNSNRVLGYFTHTIGGLAGTYVDLRLLFGIILKCKASAFAVAHNHPSGNLKPSVSDVELTRRIQRSAVILGLNFLDHLIVSRKGYVQI